MPAGRLTPGFAGRPDAQDQISGLAFAIALVGPDNTIRDVNPAAESLFGKSARRLFGQSLLDLIEVEDGRIGSMLRDSESQMIARGLAVAVDGRRLVINLSISPIGNWPGWRTITLADSVQNDRRGEDDRVGTLRGPAVLAHEIKNPLAAIRGAAQLLSRKLDDKDKALTHLITDEVDRIAQLMDRMQRLGRENPEPVAPCNLHAAIRRACDTVRAAKDTTIVIREEFDPSLPHVLANEGALVQVLINLISNACEACSDQENPQVTISTRFTSGLIMNVMHLGRTIKLPIEVKISDNGPGIDPSLREYIFEPFVSSKQNGQGLGLALVNKLVRDMSGRITHDRDEVQKWTNFRLNLPLAK